MNETTNPLPSDDATAILVVIGQYCEHDDARVIGNVAGLRALRDALDVVLSRPASRAGRQVFAPDGEGYLVHAQRLSDEKAWALKPVYAADKEDNL